MRLILSAAALSGALLTASAAGAVTVTSLDPTLGALDSGVLVAGDDLRNNTAQFDSTSRHPIAYILDEGSDVNGDQSFLLHLDISGSARNVGETSGSFQFDMGQGQSLSNVISSSLGLLASDPSNGVFYQRCVLCLSVGATIFRGLEPQQTPVVGDFVSITPNNTQALSYTVNYDLRNDGATLDEVRFVFDKSDAAVPEPASWALMIAGFGLTGAALRRRAAVQTVA